MQKGFDKLAGILLGQYYAFDKEEIFDQDNNRVYFEEILDNLTKNYSFPILKSYDFGHKCPSTFLPIGSKIEIDCIDRNLRLIEQYLT